MTLMMLRNSHPAFEGKFVLEKSSREGELVILREKDCATLKLEADLKTKSFRILDGDSTIYSSESQSP